MGFSCTRFTAMVFCLTSIVVQSSGDLIVLRSPEDDTQGTGRMLTCYSEDDDSALVWNYDNQAGETNSKYDIADYFEPKKSGPRTNTTCAIWNSTECVANWEKSFSWKLVNSAKKPTGPVLDYRWEGFEEFVFRETEVELKYLELRDMEEYSGTVVFSVRAFQDFNVFLCDEKDVTKGRCFWIRIGYSHGEKSKILACVGGVPKSNESQADRDCTDLDDIWDNVVVVINSYIFQQHETTVVDGYEWRTFRIEWKSEKQTIKLYSETEVDPFLQGTVKQWHSVSHIFIRSGISSRIRFHFYNYYLTQRKDTALFTKLFDPESEDFCIELLVGLCPDCQLEVTLVDVSGQPRARTNISGNKNSADSVPLSWKPIHLIANLKRPIPKLVRLKIGTILDDNNGKGQWAVDCFRACKSPGSLRKSTIVTYKEKVSPVSWPKVKCQKLSYGKGAVVDSLSTSTIDDNTSKLLQLARKSVMTNSNTSLGEKWSICNPTGCACERGYTGDDCKTECTLGSYGYNCNKRCGSCSSGYCDKVKGHCISGCEIDVLLPPFCEGEILSSAHSANAQHSDNPNNSFVLELELPIVEDITDTTARILQKVEPELLGYVSNFRFVIRGGDGKESLTITRSFAESTYTVNMKKLHPGTMYWVYTFVSTNISGEVTEAPSPQIISVTTLHRCSEIEPTSGDIVVRLHQDSEGCKVPEPYYAEIQKRIREPYDGSFVIPYFPSTFGKLKPYTENQPTVHEAGHRIALRTRSVRAVQLAPGKVRDLHWSNVSDTSVTLQWTVPSDVNGIIAKYNVSIKRITLLACKDLGQQTPVQDEITAEVNGTTATFNGLNPFAEYTASVIAHTTEPGLVESIKFQTRERDVPTSSVRNLRLIDNHGRLKWDRPDDCLKITGSTKSAKLVFRLSNQLNIRTWYRRVGPIISDSMDLSHPDLDLKPDTTYTVRVYVSRTDGINGLNPAWGNSINNTVYREKLFTRAASGPGKPSNLTATLKGHGDVIFTWMHQSLSSMNITRFEITIDIVNSILLEKLSTHYPKTVEYTITEYQKYYTKMVTLHPSTNYTVSVVAIDRRNQKSGAIKTELSVPTSFRFANDAKPQVTSNGTLIDVIIPTIVNPTANTTIKVIVKGLSRCTPIHSQKSSPSANLSISVTEWDAAVYQIRYETPESVKIYIEEYRGVTSICSLDPKEQYTIVFNVTDWYSGITLSISTATFSIAQTSYLAWLAVLPVVLAACVGVYIWHRNRKIIPRQLREPSYVDPIPASLITTTNVRTRRPLHQTTKVLKPVAPRRPSYLEIIPPSLTNNYIALDTSEISSHLESAKNRSSDPLYTVPNEPDSCSVSMEDFYKYAKNAAASKLLYSQFTRLRVGLTSPCEYGRLPENIPKNRSLNLIAYDNNRVVLEKIPGDFYSDYINASYIKILGPPLNIDLVHRRKSSCRRVQVAALDEISSTFQGIFLNNGYRKERAYIAAQGPTPNTVNDFWRMAWEQEVRAICMLTSITEGTETKCEKYWPDVGARMEHGDFHILNIDEQVFADYIFRTFELEFEHKTRKVTHLHYTGWPSLGVPRNPQSLVSYLRKLEQIPTRNSPILVHCSTGDDRTGTMILCDICLRCAVAEKAIDVMAVATRMRDSRANMVGTLQQYVLAHIIITESSVSCSTHIPCTDVLSSRMIKLRTRLPSDIHILKDTAWQQQALRSSALAGPPIAEQLTDGSPEKVYDDVFEEERNQIHAVSVDGVKVNKQNLACWLPSPLTLPDFWEFVAERNMKLIIILQCSDPGNPSCADIIPDESIVLPTLRIEMKNGTSLDNGEYFTEEKLLITDTSEENERSQTVTVLTCRGWECGTVQKPPKPPALISLWKASEKIPRKEGQTLVLCHDSITGCGLYLALSFLLERMTVERECDVIAAVRAVRRSKPEYVQSMEQFEYLYDVAVNYVESFQAYANFS